MVKQHSTAKNIQRDSHTHSEEMGSLFWKWVLLPAYRKCSLGVVPHAYEFLFVWEKVISLSYFPTILRATSVLGDLKAVKEDMRQGFLFAP